MTQSLVPGEEGTKSYREIYSFDTFRQLMDGQKALLAQFEQFRADTEHEISNLRAEN